MRLAWFSPMPPVATGIARCSADLVAGLRRDLDIDVFVDEANLPRVPASGQWPELQSAHDFVWRHGKSPYDLIVYQIGNSSHHDYQWPYIFRYPGVAVLHDAHLHHARASCLLRTRRADDYRREFSANHPEASPDLAEVAVAGFDSHLHYAWPMTRLVVERSRRTAVHTMVMADQLRAQSPGAHVDVIRLGHGVALQDAEARALRSEARTRLGIPAEAIVFGCYGGLTPDKRVPQILAAFAATRAYAPNAHLLLAGALVTHYDLAADVRLLGLESCTTITGYLETDEALTGAIAACDIALNLRWPTAREVSGPWLRCLACGKPTITIDLAQAADVPSIDPRTWLPNQPESRPACTVAIDIVDEDHSLGLAMRRLAADADLRTRLGAASRTYWIQNHSVDVMLDDYRALLDRAQSSSPAMSPDSLPSHLLDVGAGTLRDVVSQLGVPMPFGVDFDHTR
jgi:glycosyltransferase involved in cell wall biosynthesis